MADYQLRQPGPTIQEAIDIALNTTNLIQQEAVARQQADAQLATKAELQAETQRAQQAEALLATIAALDNEIARATGREGALNGLIEAIKALIPTQATTSNQLADKAFVNSSIEAQAADFLGTSATGLTYEQFIAWANSKNPEKNDYVYWNTVDGNENTVYKRYKYDGTQWVFEYDLNNSSFTAAQWAAINSTITLALVGKLQDLPTKAALDLLLDEKLEYEPTTDPTDEDVEDEYQRVLQVLYQAIADAQNAKADYVGNDNYVYRWNAVNQQYERTNLYVKGDPGTTDYNQLQNKPTIPTQLAQLTGDSTHRTVTDVQIEGWGEALKFEESNDPSSLFDSED